MILNKNITLPPIKFNTTDPIKSLQNYISQAIYSNSIESKIDKIKEWYNRGSLTIVFGAGPSIECGLPSWNSLISEFLIHNYIKSKDAQSLAADIFTEIFPINSLILARMINFYSETICTDIINKILYKNENIDNGKIYDSASRLCLNRDSIKKINSIITYNYDDIFERKIQKLSGRRIIHKSIYGDSMEEYRSLLPVFHVHGFIPKDISLNRNYSIVFSEDTYHSQYSNIYNWNNLIQIEKFRDTNCVFIGTSFSDPNMRRLLDISAQQSGQLSPRHMIIKKKQDFKNIMHKFKFDFELISDSFTDDDIINSLLNISKDLEEIDALSFGIETVWVDSHDEVSKILDRVL